MQLKFASSAALSLLLIAGVAHARTDKKKKGTDSNTEVSANVNKQFEWENKVVGPKEGIDKDHLAAIQEQGRREDAERKKQPQKKPERAKGIDAAGSASLPTMDIEKPAAAPVRKQKKVAAAEPHQKDSLDNLLESNGVKGDNPSGGRTGGNDGLDSIVASDSSGKKASKKHHR
ncbi:MAG TPA: hypothetical protein VHO06_13365 [Polyangia bacterium]|nr:hypothetical protein [Polyangia bacterium]